MKIGYSDFVKLCRVDDPKTWIEWLSVEPDGVYVKVFPDWLTPEERAVLSEHPTGNLKEPALKFPCTLKELETFLETTGLYGCIDAFDLLEWGMKKANDLSGGNLGPNPNASHKLSLLNQASMRFWGNVNQLDRDTHPAKAEVIQWLENHNFSPSLAPHAASIIRPEWAPAGRKPEE